jgi:A/G-specific adenine glycosylase
VKKGSDLSRFEKILRAEGITPKTITLFREIIYSFYVQNARKSLPWRKTRNPYHILLSEVMLQQTQVERVNDKYKHFLSAFPDVQSLAQAPLREVLSLWQGMGYNRRAIALQNSARKVVEEYNGILPKSVDSLEKLPGIGRATASSIAAFAFNRPVIFIETNIRRVFIHFFFQKIEMVKDNRILPLVEKTLDRKNPRKWYFALMDYGSMLKKIVENPNVRSAHYQKQSPFHGSNRQLRGKVLREIVNTSCISESSLAEKFNLDMKRTGKLLDQLQKEGFIKKKGKQYLID